MDRTEHASRLLELHDTQSFQLSEKTSLRIYSSSRSCDKSEWPSIGASMPHVLLTFLFPANRTPSEAMCTPPPCVPGHADANEWTKNMTSWCSKPVTCWDIPLPVGEMLCWILPAAALCGINQEQFQLLDYTQLKNLICLGGFRAWVRPAPHTQACLHTKCDRQDKAGWLPAELALISSGRGTMQDQTCQE